MHQAILPLCKHHSVRLLKPRWQTYYAPVLYGGARCSEAANLYGMLLYNLTWDSIKNGAGVGAAGNDAIKRHGEPEMYEAVAGLTQPTISQRIFFFK